MSSTSTNKQPLLVDRPLFDSVRETTQTGGRNNASANTLFVQGGQAPSILVDMDAALSEDNNNGGVIDSIQITRNDKFRGNDETLNVTNKDKVVSLVSGQIVFMDDPTQATVSSNNYQYGHYVYTGATALTGVLKALNYSGALTQGFFTKELLMANSLKLLLFSTRLVVQQLLFQHLVITTYFSLRQFQLIQQYVTVQM